jgi:L-lactate dehydrogenase complex protein LldE
VRVSLFITCFNDTLFPDAAGVVALLERLGCEVDFRAEQTCCGQMHGNSGYATTARRSRRFERVSRCEAIVCRVVRRRRARGYCAAACRLRPPRVRADRVPRRRCSACEDVGAVVPAPGRCTRRATPLRALHIGDRPRALLRAVRGIDSSSWTERARVLRLRRHVRGQERRTPSMAMLTTSCAHVLDTRAEVCTAATRRA